jgi:hypothetical protein
MTETTELTLKHEYSVISVILFKTVKLIKRENSIVIISK